MPDLSPTTPARPTNPDESDRTGRYEGAATPSDPAATDDIQPATLIAGKYKLLEAIGEGGMGEVWMAQQIEPVKRAVAVKFIKSGMDSKTVVARFEAERQALPERTHHRLARSGTRGLAQVLGGG
jgi:serine/threonine protein kinase